MRVLTRLALISAPLVLGCAHSSAQASSDRPAAAPTQAAAGPSAPDTSAPDAMSVSPSVSSGKLMTVAEIMRAMQASPVKYSLSAVGPFSREDRAAAATAFWGDSRAALPRVLVDANGRRHVGLVPSLTGPAAEAYNVGEAAYQRRDFAAAEQGYARALSIAPDDYTALVAYGECALFQGHLDEAAQRFTHAIDVNPAAHLAFAYRGEVELAQGKRDEAVWDYARALARRPRWPVLLAEIAQRSDRLHAHLEPDRLLPAARVTTASDGVTIAFDSSRPEWLGFAACKAFWLSDEAHRLALTGSREHEGTSTEERECLAGLLSAYETFRSDGKTQDDPGLDQAVDIVKAGMGDELIVYELLSRMNGNVTALLPPEELQKLERFIRAYVLVDDAPGGPSAEPGPGTQTARR